MKKLMLFGFAATMLFLACSKDKDKGIETKAYSASELTAASVAFHGTIVKGDVPAASGADAPVLAADMANEKYAGVAGRYIIVPLFLEAGTAKGVYAKIDGADSYFSVDFTKPRNARKAGKRDHGFARSGNAADSCLIIKVPADVKTGDIKLKVAVYDAAGKVSNTVTLSVSLYNTAAESTSQAFAGKWTLFRTQEGTGPWVVRGTPDTSYSSFVCVENKLQYAAPGTANAFNLITHIYKNNDEYIQLNANGSGASYYSDSSKSLITYNVACDSRNYELIEDIGGGNLSWYYHPTTKQLISIEEDLESSYPQDIEVMSVSAKIENGKLIIVDGDWTAEYIKK